LEDGIVEFEQALAHTAGIVSGVKAAEARVLYDLAAQAHRAKSGAVIEIGSYTGKSAVLLSATGPIYAIDHHRGNAEHQPGQPRCRPAVLVEDRVDTFPLFKANLTKAGLWDRVTPMVTDHITALQLLPASAYPVALLFADADHSELGTRLLIDLWRGKMRGVMAFHDYCAEFPGVMAAIDGAGFGPPLFQVESLIGFSVG
jgi:predicted O-methyltransferase YrrM